MSTKELMQVFLDKLEGAVKIGEVYVDTNMFDYHVGGYAFCEKNTAILVPTGGSNGPSWVMKISNSNGVFDDGSGECNHWSITLNFKHKSKFLSRDYMVGEIREMGLDNANENFKCLNLNYDAVRNVSFSTTEPRTNNHTFNYEFDYDSTVDAVAEFVNYCILELATCETERMTNLCVGCWSTYYSFKHSDDYFWQTLGREILEPYLPGFCGYGADTLKHHRYN